VLRS
jgi:hypothetical protein